MPEAHAELLLDLVLLLGMIAAHGDENRMSVNALAVVFAPSVFRAPKDSADGSPLGLLRVAGKLAGVFGVFIEEAQLIFGAEDPAAIKAKLVAEREARAKEIADLRALVEEEEKKANARDDKKKRQSTVTVLSIMSEVSEASVWAPGVRMSVVPGEWHAEVIEEQKRASMSSAMSLLSVKGQKAAPKPNARKKSGGRGRSGSRAPKKGHDDAMEVASMAPQRGDALEVASMAPQRRKSGSRKSHAHLRPRETSGSRDARSRSSSPRRRETSK